MLEGSNSKIYKKQSIALIKLSRNLLISSVGDRIEPILSLSKKLNLSIGLIQSALDILEDANAIKRNKMGTLGSFISEKNYEKLWEFSDWGIFIGIGPLPYTKKHVGLTTGIYKTMENVPFHFSYMQGAATRAEGVNANKYNFAVLSKKSALSILEKYPNLEIFCEFKENSYLSGYSLIFLDENYSKKSKLRVGLDKNSPDQYEYTKMFFKGESVEYVQTSYTKLINSLYTKKIDLFIFNKDTLEKDLIGKNVLHKDLEISSQENDGMRAVLIINKNNYGVDKFLERYLNINLVNQVQDEIMVDKIMPIY